MISFQRTLRFAISKRDSFKIRLIGVSVGNVCPFDWGVAHIYHNKISIQLTTCHMYETMQKIHDRLDGILNKKFKLHHSMDKDIRLFWNDEFQEKPNLDKDVIEKLPYYLLLSSNKNDPQLTETWLYRDTNDTIVFEVTPSYPWYYGKKPRTKKEKTEYITYEEFVKSYKPLVKIAIPKETAQQWLEQAKEMIDIIETNYRERYQNK